MGEKIPAVVSVSGGESSLYMAFNLKHLFAHKYEFNYVFSNTGLEREETLVFMDRCDKEFDLNATWIEAVVHSERGKGNTHKVVSFDTASREGEPFEAFIQKAGIPNANKPQCSDRLKAIPIEHWKKTRGLTGAPHCIGIRFDEEQRRAKASEKYNLVYPMCDWFPADKVDVHTFWEDQPFRLGLESHQGNCATCWKKSNLKLWLTALEEPALFGFMDRMEKTYPHIKPNENGQQRVFFRKNRSASDIIQEAQGMDAASLRRMIGYKDDNNSGCSESCEAYTDQAHLFEEDGVRPLVIKEGVL